MRLTLRTLLAYLDDILEPAEAAEMGKKIEESEFATGLMHRTRDVTRRLRLGAPKLEGRGMGHDPNTVAEYLDNTLPSERVPDFEKVCLESDVHLAEVASAHQILALVLGEPAEFDSRSRQRMYGLASAVPTIEVRQENGKIIVESSKSDEQGDKASKSRDSKRRKRKSKKRLRPEVPDYLRDSSESGGGRRWLVGALALLLLAGGAAFGVYSMAPETWRRWTGQGVAVSDSTEQDAASSGGQTPDAGQAPDQGVEASAAESTKSGAGDEEQTSPSAGPKDAAQAPDRSVKSTDERPIPDDPDGDAPIAPMPSDKPVRRTEQKPDGEPAGKSAAAEDGGKSTVASGEVLGRLISDHDVVLRWNQGEETWQRVPGRKSVFAGDVLLALPTYQPSIALGAGVTLQLQGGAAVELEAPDAAGASGIRVIDGRILLMTVAKPDIQLRVQAGDRRGVIAFGRDDATLAIEVERHLPDGANPETEAAAVSVDLYLASGELQWMNEGASLQSIKAPEHRSLSPNPSAPADAEMPAWIGSMDLAPIDKRAKADVDEFFVADRPASEALHELADHRRAEDSLLAMKSLALIGEFEPFAEMLGKETQKNAWTPEIESLRAAMARGPTVAARIREAFQSKYGDSKGAALYRMLWGYSREQLEAGADRQLVDLLSHPDLEFRVLSFWNLHQITGFLSGYRPEWTEAKRRPGANKWRQNLESGRIVPAAGGQ